MLAKVLNLTQTSCEQPTCLTTGESLDGNGGTLILSYVAVKNDIVEISFTMQSMLTICLREEKEAIELI
jgi:hypothetical protein